MSTLFLRSIIVTLARPISESDLREPVIQPNAIIVRSPIRVVFHIEKSLESEPNTCEMSIYNLAERTRKELEHKPMWVRVDAGYVGEERRLFCGDVRWAESTHIGTEWETKMQLGDGDRQFRFGRLSKSFRSGIDARTAVTEAARAMGFRAKFSARAELELRSQFAGGLTMAGPAHRELSLLLSRFGMTYSIQDGELQILLGNETAPDQAILISQETGMVGTPAYGSPPEPKKPPILPVTKLLDARIKPGGRVVVASRSINGMFKVQRVVHDGDTDGPPWFTQIEAKAA